MNKIHPFNFLGKYATYNYIKELCNHGKRVVVSRYGDGEYMIMLGIKKEKGIAGQEVTNKLTELLNNSIKINGQLVCLPNKTIISNNDLYRDDDVFKNKIARYIIQNSKHDIYGQVQWRDIDLLRFDSELITNFFIGKTLIISCHKDACKNAFENYKEVDIYEVPMKNASAIYNEIKVDLFSIAKKYKNIIFCAGPISKVLIADLIDKFETNLIDLGSGLGIIINPFSSYQIVRHWPGVLRKEDPEIIKKYSDKFFNTLNKKTRRN
jgi:hypothetical protein